MASSSFNAGDCSARPEQRLTGESGSISKPIDTGEAEPPSIYDVEEERGSLPPSYDHTHRKLKPRHIQFIGIGGTIGTALFVSIGRGLMQGGPASLFIAFTLWYVIYYLFVLGMILCGVTLRMSAVSLCP